MIYQSYLKPLKGQSLYNKLLYDPSAELPCYTNTTDESAKTISPFEGFVVWSFILVKPLCCLYLAPSPAMLTLLLGFGVCPVSLQNPAAGQPGEAFSLHLEFIPSISPCSATGRWSRVALSLSPAQLLSASVPPAGRPEALAADKTKAHWSSGLKRKVWKNTAKNIDL